MKRVLFIHSLSLGLGNCLTRCRYLAMKSARSEISNVVSSSTVISGALEINSLMVSSVTEGADPRNLNLLALLPVIKGELGSSDAFLLTLMNFNFLHAFSSTVAMIWMRGRSAGAKRVAPQGVRVASFRGC